MREIPDSWSERIPRRVSPKQQATLFRRVFHEGLLKNGFTCMGDPLARTANPSPRELAQMCRYARLTDDGVLQTVFFDMNEILADEDRFDPHACGATLNVCLWHMKEPLPSNPHYFWICGFSQQRVTGFRYPGMEADFRPSFINVYCDDFPFALALEKELFFEQTLPLLDAHATVQSLAAWWMETLDPRWQMTARPDCAIWPQLESHLWEEAQACVDMGLARLAEIGAGEAHRAPWLRLQELVAHRSSADVNALLETNRAANQPLLPSLVPGLFPLQADMATD